MKYSPLWALMLAMSVVTAKSGDPQLAGKWAAESRTKGGLGALFIFTDDGLVTNIFGALVDSKYQIEGQTIVQTPYEPEAGKIRWPFTILGNTLTESDPANPTNRLEMTRLGPPKPGRPAVEGLWTYKHYTGVMATVEFTSGGLQQLSVPMMISSGRYKLQTNELTLELQGQPPSKRTILLSRDSLTLSATSSEPVQKFTRVVP